MPIHIPSSQVALNAGILGSVAFTLQESVDGVPLYQEHVYRLLSRANFVPGSTVKLMACFI